MHKWLVLATTVLFVAVGCGGTTTATPAGSGAHSSGSAESTFKWGAPAKAGPLTITVSAPVAGKTPYVGRWQAVHVRACSTKTGTTVNPFDFVGRAASDDQLSPGIGRDPALHAATLGAGECTAGWVNFPAKPRMVAVKYEGMDSDLNTYIATWG